MSIFSEILSGDLPAYHVAENEHAFAFLALDQVQMGHTLVVPKIEVDHFFDVPEPHYSAVFTLAKTVAPAIKAYSGALRVGCAVVGVEVPHFHYHLIPINAATDLDFRKAKRLSEAQMEAIHQGILKEMNS